MRKIVVASSFRDAVPYLSRYFAQLVALDEALHRRGDKLMCLWGEGDSTDATLRTLQGAAFRFNAKVIDVTHGGKKYHSIVNLQRFRQLAFVGNKIWEALPADADVVLWVESDLMWDAATLVKLIDRLQTYPCVAPMVLDSLPATGAEANRTFYDIFAYRRNSVGFTKARPYHPDLLTLHATDGMLRMDSVGSCVALRADVAREVYFPVTDVFVGLCKLIYDNGESVWLDSTQVVWHP